MTPDELRDLVVAADREKLCQALAPLDERQREELNDFAWRLYRQIDGAWSSVVFKEKRDLRPYGDDAAAFIEALRKQKYKDWRTPRIAVGLAVLALCDVKRIQNPERDGIGGWLRGDLRDMPRRTLQILDARRPPWLAKWIQAELKRERPAITWFVERGLIRSGALPANQTDAYIRRMAEERTSFDLDLDFDLDDLKQEFKSWKEVLLADPALLEHEVWRLFKVETNAFCYFFNRWANALKELSDEGRLDRARLLQASARAASLPIKQIALRAYGIFHEFLKPTIDEREKLIGEYFSLLESPVPVMVGFALKAIEALAKAERLAADAFIAACEPVFRLDKKVHPIKAIQLTKLLLKQNPQCRESATLAMAKGLASDIAEVQEAALSVLESLKDYIGRETVDAVDDSEEHISASLKPRLRALVEGTKASHHAPPAMADGKMKQAKSEPRPDFEQRVSVIPAEIRRQTGVDLAITCIRDGGEPQVFALDPRHIPRRDPAARVAPLESLDELIDSVVALCEGVDDAMEIERILDGIARFHRRPPADFDKRVDALRKRVDKQSEPWSRTVLDLGGDLGLTQVIRRWLRMPPIEREVFGWGDQRESLYRKRLQELCWYLDKDDEGPRGLLALPTHQGGWLDPVALAERLLRDYVEPKEMPDQYDLAQAILRLTVEGRPQALKMLGKPSYYNGGHQLFYALGAPMEFTSYGGYGSDALNAASVRVRAQLEDPDRFHPPRALATANFDAIGNVMLSGPVARDPALPSQLLDVVYGPAAANGSERMVGPRDWQIEWENLCYPFDHRPSLMMAGLCPSQSRSRLTPLFDCDTVWQAEAARAAIVAASADRADARSLATDALVEGVGAMLVDPVILGKQMTAVFSIVKLNRVAAVLKETAAVSPLHHWSVFRAIDAALAACDQVPTDFHHLLSLMIESGAVLGISISAEAAARLKVLGATGKTAKQAKQLVQLPGGGRRMAEVRVQACEAAIARAERWRRLARDLEISEILGTVAASQEEQTMSDAEADALRSAMGRPAESVRAASLPKRKR